MDEISALETARRSMVRDPEFLAIVAGLRLGSDAPLPARAHIVDRRSSAGILEWVLFGIVAVLVLGVAVFFVARPASGSSERIACSTIQYVVNPDAMPPDALSDLEHAARQITEVTGIHFEFAGLTNELPSTERHNGTVLIAWAPADLFASLDHPNDVAGWTTYRWATSAAGTRFVEGWVYLNAAQDRASGFDDRRAWGGVLLHELGHLVGLEHSVDPTQIMYPELQPGAAVWGAEDISVLRATGARAGCLAPG